MLCEIIINDQLHEGCEIKFRTFYVLDHIVFVFGNDPKTLADVVMERTKEYIRQYHAQYPLKGKDFDCFLRYTCMSYFQEFGDGITGVGINQIHTYTQDSIANNLSSA